MNTVGALWRTRHRLATRRAWLRRQATPRRITFFGVVSLAAIGFGFWVKASDGTKQVDLGSAILGGLVVGIAVILAERHFTRTVETQRDDIRSLTPTAPSEPSRDIPRADEQPSPDTAPADENQPRAPSIPPGRYTVVYDSREMVRDRADAVQARLRMHREYLMPMGEVDQEYVQFITALAPGRVDRQDNIEPDRFWWSFCRLAGQMAERALRDGLIPLEDRTMAFEVAPSVETAFRLARREGGVVDEDEVVHEFRVGGPVHELRRAKAEGLSVRAGLKSGEHTGLWGVAEIDEAAGYVTFLVPVTMGTTSERMVALDQIAWVEVTDIAW